MRKHDDVRIDAERSRSPGVDAGRAVPEVQRRLRADGAAGGEAEMADDDVGARDRHCGRFLLAEHVGRGQHVLLMRLRDHLDLQRIGHASFFQIGAEQAVDQADGREVLHAGEAQCLQLVEEDIHVAERIGAVDAGKHRRPGNDRQDFAGHFDHDRIGIAVGHEARRASRGRPCGSGRNCRSRSGRRRRPPRIWPTGPCRRRHRRSARPAPPSPGIYATAPCVQISTSVTSPLCAVHRRARARGGTRRRWWRRIQDH